MENQNAVKKRRFAEAIERALLADDGAKLRALAEKLISLAEAGDLAATMEVIDRVEGITAYPVSRPVNDRRTTTRN